MSPFSLKFQGQLYKVSVSFSSTFSLDNRSLKYIYLNDNVLQKQCFVSRLGHFITHDLYCILFIRCLNSDHIYIVSVVCVLFTSFDIFC